MPTRPHGAASCAIRASAWSASRWSRARRGRGGRWPPVRCEAALSFEHRLGAFAAAERRGGIHASAPDRVGVASTAHQPAGPRTPHAHRASRRGHCATQCATAVVARGHGLAHAGTPLRPPSCRKLAHVAHMGASWRRVARLGTTRDTVFESLIAHHASCPFSGDPGGVLAAGDCGQGARERRTRTLPSAATTNGCCGTAARA